MSERPVPLAMLLADQVYQDRETGKWIVAGIFSTIGCGALPTRQDSLTIFFQVTDIARPTPIRLRIEHSEGEIVLLDLPGRVQANSPLDVISQKVLLHNVPLPQAGKYWVQLLSEGEIVTQIPLHVRLVQAIEQQGASGAGAES